MYLCTNNTHVYQLRYWKHILTSFYVSRLINELVSTNEAITDLANNDIPTYLQRTSY
jgi:hypothetical protein